MRSRDFGYIIFSLIASLSLMFLLLSSIRLNPNFETIELGYYCYHDERQDYIIQSQQEWDELWQETHGNSSEALYINFNSSIVIAVYMGAHATGGYSIEIINIFESRTEQMVFIREISPGPFGPTTMAFTQPYHIVIALRNVKPIVLIHY